MGSGHLGRTSGAAPISVLEAAAKWIIYGEMNIRGKCLQLQRPINSLMILDIYLQGSSNLLDMHF
jgi:hypothetical protein